MYFTCFYSLFCLGADEASKENNLQYDDISDDEEDLDAILNKASSDAEEEKKRELLETL